MNINIDSIKDHLQFAYHFVKNESGKFKHRAVEGLHQALVHVRQDSRSAVAVVAGSSIIVLETALLTTSLANKIFTTCFGSDKHWGEGKRVAHSWAIFFIFSGSLVGMNVALYERLKLPLTPLAITGINVASCTAYIFMRLFAASFQQSTDS